jgi:hypothetical protein
MLLWGLAELDDIMLRGTLDFAIISTALIWTKITNFD